MLLEVIFRPSAPSKTSFLEVWYSRKMFTADIDTFTIDISNYKNLFIEYTIRKNKGEACRNGKLGHT